MTAMRTWQVFRVGARHRIIDDRRQVVPLCMPDQLSVEAPHALRVVVRDGNAHRWSAIMWEGGRALLYVLLFQLLMSGIGCRVTPTMLASPNMWMGVVMKFGWMVVMWAPLFLLINSLHARGRGIAAIKALHAAGLCPSCAYDLRRVEAAADGCTVCPECGGAWRRRDEAGGRGGGGEPS